MSAKLKVLVTGATGHLGTAVCQALLEAGHEVKAADRKYVKDFCVKPVLGDLLDEHFVYGLVEGCDAVVHLGNHPNAFAGPSPQQILSDNVRMNANVFWAAVQTGVQRIVFASSVQVMLRSAGGRREAPYEIPYLPLDGNAPTDPGTNAYAMSKEMGERALQLLCAENPGLAATALRYPMLPREPWVQHLRQAKVSLPGWTNIGECMTHLLLSDAGAIAVKAVERSWPGYRQYFPAVSMKLLGKSAQDLYREYYCHVPLHCPIEELTDLVDNSLLEKELGWTPAERIEINLADS